MPFCSRCGKATEPGPLCEDCARTAEAPAPEPAVSAAAPAAPDAATPDRPSFSRAFLADPVGALRDVWLERRLRYAWISLLWIVLSMFLSSFLADLTTMFSRNLGFQLILPTLGRAVLAPVPVLCAMLAAVPLFAWIARKGPSGAKSSAGRALAAFGAASIPYAAALTLYIPVAVAESLLDPMGLAAAILSYYPVVVVEPLRLGAIVLTLFACRAVSGTPRDSRPALGGIAVLVLTALVLGVVGYFAGLAVPPLSDWMD